jgi:3-deoxy-7-phosphoheptulonate synthase
MNNINIKEFRPLIKPNVLCDMIPITEEITDLVEHTRREIQDILMGKSKRKLFIVGPCSVHNTEEALECVYILRNQEQL